MGKGALLRWGENQVLKRHLRGQGIEIGALWRRFPVRASVKVWYVDRMDPGALRDQYSEISSTVIAPDIIADASQLPVQPGSLDFIVASHVLEHLHFPLSAIRNWYDSLCAGGALLLRVPDARFTFDRHRKRTPLAHLLAEEASPSTFSRELHFEDWVENVQQRKLGSAEFETELHNLMEIDYSIHYHVWIDQDILEIINYTRSHLQMQWQPIFFWKSHFYRKETIALLRRAN